MIRSIQKIYTSWPPGLAFLFAVGFLMPSLTVGTSAQEPAKLSIPVRVFSTDASGAPDVAAGAMQQAATFPSGGLPPQYQTTRQTRIASEPQENDERLRFIVALVEQPILVETKITVDGKPFRSVREERIDKLLQEISQPESTPPPVAAPAETTTDEASDTLPAKTDLPPKLTVDNSIVARMRRYSAATKRPPSRDEVRWLLTNWADGPTLLLLHENYQRARAEASPLFKVLDRDEDRVLSAEEIASAEKSMWKYDANQDEVLSLNEINKAAQRTPENDNVAPMLPPLIPLEQLANAQTFRRLCDHYKSPLPRFDHDGDEVVSESEVADLRSVQTDLLVQVSFNTQHSDRSRLEVLANNLPSKDTKPMVREMSLTLYSGGTLIELSAVQSQNMRESDQVSLGAVRDGYPLLPEIDANEDGRLTIRELWQVSKRVASFDQDQDGKVAKTELPPTLRVSFGLGPIVHQQLATVRSLHPAVVTATPSPPDWFTRMDRNQDGDLTLREFLGGKEQFTSLDGDQDNLVSIAEAITKE